MSREQRLREAYDDQIRPRLQSLEEHRKRALKQGLAWFVCAVAVLYGAQLLLGLLLEGRWWLMLTFASILVVGVSFAYRKYGAGGESLFGSYRARYKREVVSAVFGVVCPTARYEPEKGLSREAFMESGLFTTRFDRYESEDLVRGHIGVTPFEAAEVRTSYSTGRRESRRTFVVMGGLYLRLDFNKRLRGRTLVQPANAPDWRMGARGGLEPVRLENFEFESHFDVYGSDAVEARYVLTPALMERILELGMGGTTQLYLAFLGEHVHLAFHYERPLFEPPTIGPISFETVLALAKDFGVAETVVSELDLNTRIWTKAAPVAVNDGTVPRSGSR